MTAAGWTFMLGSWLVILGVFGFALWRTLRAGPRAGAGADPALTPPRGD